MSRTSHQPPQLSNSRNTSASLELLKASDSSPRKERPSMPSCASSRQRNPQEPRLRPIFRISTESKYSSTTTRLRKLESNSMKKCMTRLISKTLRRQTLMLLRWWADLKSMLSWTSSLLWSNLNCNNKRTSTDNNKTSKENLMCRDLDLLTLTLPPSQDKCLLNKWWANNKCLKVLTHSSNSNSCNISNTWSHNKDTNRWWCNNNNNKFLKALPPTLCHPTFRNIWLSQSLLSQQWMLLTLTTSIKSEKSSSNS